MHFEHLLMDVILQKYFLDTYVEKGLGGACRFPLGPANEKTKKMIDTDLKEDWEYECSLAGEAKA